MRRRDVSRWLSTGLVAGAFGWPAARAQAWPSKPIKLVNPFPPGSPVDVVARPLAQKLQDLLGQPVVVEYKAGAGGTLGAEQVARAPADGYTLLVTSASTHVIAPSLRRNLPYDAQKDFTPLALLAYGPTAIVAHPSVPAQNLAEFVQHARANPGKVAYASSGLGTILHLSGELFASRTGVQLLHVPYKGAVPASTDLLGGQVQVMFDSITNAAPQVRAGKLRALAVLTPQRSPLMPDVPTAIEQNFTGLEFPAWIGAFAPSGLPPPVAERLAQALKTIMEQAETRERFTQAGLIPSQLQGEAFAREMASQARFVGELVRSARIELQ
jgi:tripartite-type tricarboxylate transporter receptor subunit TctC